MLTQIFDAAPAAARDPRWASVLARDAGADGAFVFAVRSTGIYCRPSCPARHAKPENVEFHENCAEAERAGFRACRRCRPNEAGSVEKRAAMVAKVCRVIEAAEEPPSLEALARRAGVSASHLHRTFKAVTGVTPRAYASAERAKRARDELGRGDGSVASAIYGAGFNSSGRFYEAADAMLGMTPTAYRRQGAEEKIRFAVAECSLGAIVVASSARGVCSILLGDDPEVLTRDLQDRFRNAELIGGDADFEAVVAKVVGFVDAPRIGLDLPLDLRGTAFQQRVWAALREIAPGTTESYAQVAARIGAPQSSRAVALACGANPVAVAVPCHRVVRADGGLSGYRWGVERKRALLASEA